MITGAEKFLLGLERNYISKKSANERQLKKIFKQHKEKGFNQHFSCMGIKGNIKLISSNEVGVALAESAMLAANVIDDVIIVYIDENGLWFIYCDNGEIHERRIEEGSLTSLEIGLLDQVLSKDGKVISINEALNYAINENPSQQYLELIKSENVVKITTEEINNVSAKYLIRESECNKVKVPKTLTEKVTSLAVPVVFILAVVFFWSSGETERKQIKKTYAYSALEKDIYNGISPKARLLQIQESLIYSQRAVGWQFKQLDAKADQTSMLFERYDGGKQSQLMGLASQYGYNVNFITQRKAVLSRSTIKVPVLDEVVLPTLSEYVNYLQEFNNDWFTNTNIKGDTPILKEYWDEQTIGLTFTEQSHFDIDLMGTLFNHLPNTFVSFTVNVNSFGGYDGKLIIKAFGCHESCSIDK